MVARGQLDDVSHQGRGTQAKYVDPHKAHRPPKEGVEVATASMDAALGPTWAPAAAPQPGLQAVQHALAHHDRGCRRSEGQAEEHEQRDKLLAGLHVGHGERAVVALETHLGRLEEVSQLQEVERHDGGCHYGQLHEIEAGQKRHAVLRGFILLLGRDHGAAEAVLDGTKPRWRSRGAD